jgi:hypothetical protein
MVYASAPAPQNTSKAEPVFSQVYSRWSWRVRRCAETQRFIWGPCWMTVEYVEYVDELVEDQIGKLTMHRTRRKRINRWLSKKGKFIWLLKR